jgi:hypothetical protein
LYVANQWINAWSWTYPSSSPSYWTRIAINNCCCMCCMCCCCNYWSQDGCGDIYNNNCAGVIINNWIRIPNGCGPGSCCGFNAPNHLGGNNVVLTDPDTWFKIRDCCGNIYSIPGYRSCC